MIAIKAMKFMNAAGAVDVKEADITFEKMDSGLVYLTIVAGSRRTRCVLSPEAWAEIQKGSA